MGCGNLLSGPNSNHRLETTVYRPSDYTTLSTVTGGKLQASLPGSPNALNCRVASPRFFFAKESAEKTTCIDYLNLPTKEMSAKRRSSSIHFPMPPDRAPFRQHLVLGTLPWLMSCKSLRPECLLDSVCLTHVAKLYTPCRSSVEENS